MALTQRIADYAASADWDTLPRSVRERAKRLLLDYLGNAVRGASLSDSSPVFRKTLTALGIHNGGDLRVAGSAEGHGPAAAAMLAGIYAHSLDFDDTHGESSLHPSAPVISAALAAAQMTGADGKATLAAIVAGFEVCCRLGLALDPTAHYRRGYHPTATAGAFGAAVAAGKLMGLSARQQEAALGAVLSLAAGSLQFLENGSWNKRFQVGAAAMNGIMGARLALDGFVGATAAVEGKHGLLAMYTDEPHPEKAVAGLGERYETLAIGVKPYPSCRYTHASIDLLLALREEHGLTADEVQSVEVAMHSNGVRLTGEPIAAKKNPQSIVDGQFSMPFVGAVALHQGRFGWDDYALLSDAEVLSVADRFSVRTDKTLDRDSKLLFSGAVIIETSRGTFKGARNLPSGEPDEFPDDPSFRAKFQSLAAPVIGANAARLADEVLEFEHVENVHAFLAATAPEGRGTERAA
ncbi:MmgE/PrpD family protein [Chelativorans sp. YIM 93263]|uniref:MmgE/PrpD family protein n=1 Tax=Chelativorans sp. YIM 93263 TaxID=2906648 RepID=UPI0023794496|nr:MmgE/PrpD family protein [Chelativorans sp. YIM 93263]